MENGRRKWGKGGVAGGSGVVGAGSWEAIDGRIAADREE